MLRDCFGNILQQNELFQYNTDTYYFILMQCFKIFFFKLFVFCRGILGCSELQWTFQKLFLLEIYSQLLGSWNSDFISATRNVFLQWLFISISSRHSGQQFISHPIDIWEPESFFWSFADLHQSRIEVLPYDEAKKEYLGTIYKPIFMFALASLPEKASAIAKQNEEICRSFLKLNVSSLPASPCSTKRP